MNYFPFHIGDYAAHTAHLEPMEDLAYRRMLDWYYLNERALPGDPMKVARLIRMPKSREAIQTVLTEFFALSEDGFHSKRADAELTSMLSKQEQQGTKDAHEAERMRRHRERRAEMFAALRSGGVVPAWDVPMKELQRLLDESCNAPETRTGALPATDSQRLSLPTPTPTPIQRQIQGGENIGAPPSPPHNSEIETEGHKPTSAGLLCRAIKSEGIPDVNPGHADLLRLLAAGIPSESFTATAAELVARGKGGFAYLLRTVENRWRDAASAPPVPTAPILGVVAVAETSRLLREQAEAGERAKSPEAQAARRAAMSRIRGVSA